MCTYDCWFIKNIMYWDTHTQITLTKVYCHVEGYGKTNQYAGVELK